METEPTDKQTEQTEQEVNENPYNDVDNSNGGQIGDNQEDPSQMFREENDSLKKQLADSALEIDRQNKAIEDMQREMQSQEKKGEGNVEVATEGEVPSVEESKLNDLTRKVDIQSLVNDGMDKEEATKIVDLAAEKNYSVEDATILYKSKNMDSEGLSNTPQPVQPNMNVPQGKDPVKMTDQELRTAVHKEGF